MPFPKILVTGPQRSGTTITAAMIAADLGHRLHLEERVRVSELWRMKGLFEKSYKFVLQAPALCHYAHEVAAPDVAVILVRRDVNDIIASQRRINWTGEQAELARYGLKTGVISEIKYRYWEEHQKHLIQNAFEIEYESLAQHPMWVPKAHRARFGPRQYSERKERMKTARIVYYDDSAGRNRWITLKGEQVHYEEADELLGPDFVKIVADEDSFTVKREDLKHVHIG